MLSGGDGEGEIVGRDVSTEGVGLLGSGAVVASLFRAKTKLGWGERVPNETSWRGTALSSGLPSSTFEGSRTLVLLQMMKQA